MKWILVLFLAAAVPAYGDTRCYQFEVETPARDSHDSVRTERWCYQVAGGNLFIFNADEEEVKPELSLIKNQDGSVTHGSLLADQVTYHRVLGLNPFPVPLDIPARSPSAELLSDHTLASAQRVLSQLQSASPELITLTAEGGPKAAQARQPWRGFWWPYKNFTIGPVLSKYDRYVTARTGSNPGSYNWERSHHFYKGVWWEGHCNGWAASAILRSQPTISRRDSSTGLVFSVSDQKGILAEHDYCARATMYGKRYRGGGDNIWDMEPALFHNTILYYIGRLGKPLAMDYRRDGAVDNHVVSGYGMQIVRSSPTLLNVITTLRVHRYDSKKTEIPGIAPAYTRVYKYELRQDGNGRTVGGRWLSNNPDFLWAPLGPTNCKRNGAELQEAHVQSILRI
jgi:hypothetical protein